MDSSADAVSQKMSLAERAYEILRHRLIMLDIAPGDPINEAGLSAELDVGRTPIREALKRLESDHLVVSYSRRGTFASNIDLKDLSTISEMREVLEPIAARKAARNITPERCREFEATIADLRELKETDEPRALVERDLEVHRLIYSSVDNPHLMETLVRLDDLATRIWCLVIPRIPDLIGHIREHIDLLEAILEGKESAVEAHAAEHVREFDKTLRAALH
ncbi:MAG: GntR family transcriptional regulator [Brevibacterium sp.]|nr:GntR family transcriptional regulator [Brevibacterium sp.]MDN5834934.1 GntR family transcriptional regulator [Brevibacterium sp.]MDN6123744.1 GntR family transcriptional regulator [Brevibacterium sp.]MDN6135325.1 GntR family transcriptional regulator [Brevibacterium sp.]MDN6175292.1 GntR family transcriptional regulator [Brevibacterium sp.]